MLERELTRSGGYVEVDGETQSKTLNIGQVMTASAIKKKEPLVCRIGDSDLGLYC